ncbi:hypothetical protein [Cellulomonas sp. ATA003]|uniref:hypothetical protein n=1 Tax=Cellulomonas sp. ATA003 TaxID=3073064 RepID=UPI002873EAB7|nr:hypothetical protein [Cellulomonas sp. ATA003]WNB87351.1 hypothetical protein REH70_09785 [Cellulomonas sp. ATA003]
MTSSPDHLRPGPTALPDHVRMADVGPVGWQVLVRDGVLRPVWGDVAAPAAVPPGPHVRARAVRPLVPPRAVLGRAGAVWVHADGPVPPRFDVLVAPRVRRPAPHPLRVPHECPLPPADVVRLGGVAVTTVERTAVDVARHLPLDEAVTLLVRLAVHARLDLRAALRAAAELGPRHGGPRVREVLARAEGAARVPDRAAGQTEGWTGAAGSPAALDPVIR